MRCYGYFLQERCLTVDRRFRFFFRLNVESTKADTCTHGIPPVPFEVLGSFRKERCSTHTQVEWDVTEREEMNRTSPVFEIGSQSFFFLNNKYGYELVVFILGRPLFRSARWWAGLRLGDGSYHHGTDSGELDQREDLGLWTRFCKINIFASVQRDILRRGRPRFFFRVSEESTGEGTCTHGIPAMSTPISGSIREERCSTHTHVEWEIVDETLNERADVLASPVFHIGSQFYFLELSSITSSFSVSRMGRSESRFFRWWAGFRVRDGNHLLTHASGELDLRENLGFWTRIADLTDSLPVILKEKSLNSDGRLSFFFRLNVDPSEEGTCTHGPVDIHASEFEGSIRKEDCPSHGQLVWDLPYVSSKDMKWKKRSPVLEVGNQRYQLKMCYQRYGPLILRVCRLGRYVEGPSRLVQCWMGFQRENGTYDHQMQVVYLDLSQDCSLWAEVDSFCLPSLSHLERTHVASKGRLAIFLRMDWIPAGEGTCAHGATQMCTTGQGIIRQMKSHLVEWDVTCEAPWENAHISTSPAFWIGDQCYLLELLYREDDVLAFSVYRFGLPAHSVRCWAGFRGVQGTYYHWTEGMKLDLQKFRELWTRAAVLAHYRLSDLEKWRVASDGRMTFVFKVDSSEYEDRLRRDYRLWLQHPEEAENIRRRRKGEAEDRMRRHPLAGSSSGKLSFCAA